MLRIIRGRAGSGKTALLFKLISEVLNEEDGAPVLIVPEQFSFVTERELLKHLGAAKTKRVTVTSFSRLAKICLNENNACLPPAADDGIKAVIMKKALESLEGRLNIFSGFDESTGSLKALVDFDKQLKLSGAREEDFRLFFEKNEDAFLNEKLKELLLIGDTYEAILKNSFFDTTDALHLFNNAPECTAFFEGKTVFVDSFRSFSSPELECICTAAQKAKDVYIALCGEKPAEGDGAFRFMADFEDKLVAASKKKNVKIAVPVVLNEAKGYTEDISYIEQNVFTEDAAPKEVSDGSVKILKCDDRLSECRAVACEIKKLLRSGYRCRDIVIIERTANTYKKELTDTLLSFGIPVFNDSKRPLEFEALFAFCFSVLDCDTDSFSTENIMRYLKSALSPLSFEESAKLEKYALVWGISGKSWATDFNMNPNGFGVPDSKVTADELRILNELRKRAVLPLLKLKESSKEKNGEEICKVFFDFISGLSVTDRLFDVYESLENEGFPDEADRVRRSWAQLIRVLDDLSSFCGNETMSLKKWYEYFKTIAVSREVGEIPRGLDEVTIGSADRIRTSNVKAAFLVGVNRDEFPLVNIGGGLLTDRDKLLLFENGIELRAPYEYAVNEERFIAYCALTAATEKLFLSYKTISPNGGSTEKSPLISEISALLPSAKIITVSKMSPEYRIESDESAFRELSVSYSLNNGKRTALLRYFEGNSEYKGRIAAIGRLFDKTPLAFENKDISTRLFGKTVNVSASRVEEYYKCPFKYFCRYGVKLKALEKAELDPRQSGTAIHFVLEALLKHYGFKKLVEASDEKLRAYISELLDLYIDENMGGKENKTKRFMFLYGRLVDIALTVVGRLRTEFAVTSFEPVDFELKIGEDIPAYELPLENGKALITGSIDRVDMMEKDGITYLRVIDYKTGKKVFNLSALLSGLNIQPVLYLMTLLKNGEERYGKALPAGVLYLPSRIGISDYLSERNPSPETVEQKKRASGKLSGMLLLSPVSLNGMGAEVYPDYLPAGYNKKGTPRGNYYELSQFKALTKIIDSEIENMGNALHDGKTDIMPSVFKGASPCEYCEYRAVCTREDSDPYKELESKNHSEALKILDEEAIKYGLDS